MDHQQIINDSLILLGIMKKTETEEEKDEKKRKKSMREIFHVKIKTKKKKNK